MRIDIITIFPEVFTPLQHSILKRAVKKGILQIELWNLRDFTEDRHKKVDDTPYGGGKGMVLKCEPIFRTLEAIKRENKGRVILTTPQGALFSQETAKELSREESIVVICGHYEGIDERVLSVVDCEISIGNYVLTGGELPAMVIVDSVARLVPGVLSEKVVKYESFHRSLLDWPCYTKPEVFREMRVPDVLLSGNHKKIEEWRRGQAEERTKRRMPGLYRKYLKEKREDE